MTASIADDPLTDHEDWHRQIEVTAKLYRVARLRAAEAIVNRLALLEPDSSGSHAAQEEIRALEEYSELLGAYSRILAKESASLHGTIGLSPR